MLDAATLTLWQCPYFVRRTSSNCWPTVAFGHHLAAHPGQSTTSKSRHVPDFLPTCPCHRPVFPDSCGRGPAGLALRHTPIPVSCSRACTCSRWFGLLRERRLAHLRGLHSVFSGETRFCLSARAPRRPSLANSSHAYLKDRCRRYFVIDSYQLCLIGAAWSGGGPPAALAEAAK